MKKTFTDVSPESFRILKATVHACVKQGESITREPQCINQERIDKKKNQKNYRTHYIKDSCDKYGRSSIKVVG